MELPYPEQHIVKNGQIVTCQVCNSNKLHLVLDYGQQPLSDSLLDEADLSKPEAKYPLRMLWCEDCSLAQIDYSVDRKVIYASDYPYRTGMTKELVEYLSGWAGDLVSHFKLTKADLVVDIGSNDGTFLNGFKKSGVKVLGVEPTDAADVAVNNGIETVKDFFDIKTAQDIKNKHGQASLVVAVNVLERVSALGEVLVGVHELLKDGGVFVVESHYLLDVIKGGQFDTIYHEHLRTFSLKSLIKLFSYYDFTVVEVEKGFGYRHNIKLQVAKGKDHAVSQSVEDWLKAESEGGLNNAETYTHFAERARECRKCFVEFIEQAKRDGKKMTANSCPARSVVMLNYFGIADDSISYIAEHPHSPKVGKYFPGKHIPIVSSEKLIADQPDYVILLAWYYADNIMAQLKARGLRSDFVIPLPDFRVEKNSSSG